MLPAHRLVIDGEVVVLAAPDLHVGAHEVELFALDRSGQADEARHFCLFEIAHLRGPAVEPLQVG